VHDRGFATDSAADVCARGAHHWEIDRRRGQMVQDLANLAAVFVVRDLRRCRRVLDDRHRQPARKRQVMVMPGEQDGLEQDREEAKPRGGGSGNATTA